MVAYYPHRVASRDRFETENDAHRADDGLGSRVLNQVRQAFCGIQGHDALVQFESDRMFLKCFSCGHESPGWVLDEAPKTVTTRGEARHRVLSAHLVGIRRIA